MNERIKQFEKDSGLEIYGLGQDRVKWKSVVEKFAQLIVQECVGIADEYDGAGSTIVSRIEQHFGVEE